MRKITITALLCTPFHQTCRGGASFLILSLVVICLKRKTTPCHRINIKVMFILIGEADKPSALVIFPHIDKGSE